MASLSDNESSHEGGDGGGHRNTKKFSPRGMTAKKNIIHRISKGHEKYKVRWNVKGLPIGENGTNLISFIGTKVKQMFPISIKSWNEKDNRVLPILKDDFWSLIQKHFDVDDARRDWILKEAGRLHRAYKTDVGKKYLKLPDGTIRQEPPALYSGIISKEDWSKLVHIRTTDPDFLKKSKANKERASNPEYPYRGGSSGYQILEERLLLREGKDPTQESLDRCTVWLEARQNKDGDIVDPKTKEVKDKIQSISQSVSQGDLTDCDGQQDVLARALGREERQGRIRGYGYGIPPTTVFGPKSHSRGCGQCKVMADKYDELSKNVAVLMEERQMYKQLLAQSIGAPSPAAPPPVEPILPAAPSFALHSARDSCSIPSTQDNCECELYIANPHRKVAVGMLCNQLSATMHNLPMPENHLRVRVDYSIEGSAPLPVPIVNADIFTVDQALSTFVAWPEQLVVVPQVSRPSPSIKVSRRSPSTTKVSRPSPSIQPVQHVVKSPNVEFEKFITYVKEYVTKKMKPGDLIMLPTDHIVGVEQDIMLNIEDLKAVYDMEWATVVVIRVYQRFLYNNFLVHSHRTQKFLFLCPECIIVWDDGKPEDIMARKSQIENYILTRFMDAKHFDHESLFLAPLNIRQHWVLFAINPKRNAVYYLDSLQGHYKVYVDFVKIVDSALTQYWGYSTSKTKWIPITCPKQPNNNDCGYYTMRYMREIITHDSVVIPIKYFPHCKDIQHYSDEQLTTVRGEWCRFVSSFL